MWDVCKPPHGHRVGYMTIRMKNVFFVDAENRYDPELHRADLITMWYMCNGDHIEFEHALGLIKQMGCTDAIWWQ
jgi:hypothetical protein